MAGKKVVLNPGRRRLKGGEAGVFMATSQAALDDALTRPFSRPLHPSDPRHYLDAPMPAVSISCSSAPFGGSAHSRGLELPCSCKAVEDDQAAGSECLEGTAF